MARLRRTDAAARTPAISAHARPARGARRRRLRAQHGADRRPRRDPRSTSRSPRATGCARRSPTRSASAASSARCAPPTTCSASGASSPSSRRTRGCSTTRTRWRCSAGSSTQGRRRSNVVGLCHSVQYTVADLAELVGVPVERGDVPRGRASTTRRSSCASSATARISTRCSTARIAGDPELQRRVRVALLSPPGYFPTESGEHAAEYVPWFLRARRPDRALPHTGQRVHPAQRAEPGRVRAGEGPASRAARRCRSRARSSTPR